MNLVELQKYCVGRGLSSNFLEKGGGFAQKSSVARSTTPTAALLVIDCPWHFGLPLEIIYEEPQEAASTRYEHYLVSVKFVWSSTSTNYPLNINLGSKPFDTARALNKLKLLTT